MRGSLPGFASGLHNDRATQVPGRRRAIGSLASMRIAKALADEIVAHSREDAPNECCGLIGGRDGEATSVHRAENLFASPLRFEVKNPVPLLRAIEDAGEDLAGIYHSHTRSEAYPVADRRQPRAGLAGPVVVHLLAQGPRGAGAPRLRDPRRGDRRGPARGDLTVAESEPAAAASRRSTRATRASGSCRSSRPGTRPRPS